MLFAAVFATLFAGRTDCKDCLQSVLFARHSHICRLGLCSRPYPVVRIKSTGVVAQARVIPPGVISAVIPTLLHGRRTGLQRLEHGCSPFADITKHRPRRLPTIPTSVYPDRHPGANSPCHLSSDAYISKLAAAKASSSSSAWTAHSLLASLPHHHHQRRRTRRARCPAHTPPRTLAAHPLHTVFAHWLVPVADSHSHGRPLPHIRSPVPAAPGAVPVHPRARFRLQRHHVRAHRHLPARHRRRPPVPVPATVPARRQLPVPVLAAQRFSKTRLPDLDKSRRHSPAALQATGNVPHKTLRVRASAAPRVSVAPTLMLSCIFFVFALFATTLPVDCLNVQRTTI